MRDTKSALVITISAVLALLTLTPRSLAQSTEPTLPPSPRITINLSGGMPGQSPWLYIRDQDSPSATAPTFAEPSFPDSTWTPVGVPYSTNPLNTFLNETSGGFNQVGTVNWYRLHFTLAPQYANSKLLVEFEGAHTGAQVFINGTLLPGISAVTADAQASHVVGFIPFIVDLTPYVKADGNTENVLAVRVSRSATWFENPGFSEVFRFGQADAGLFRPVNMYITNMVHIPQNIYSNLKTWGTYVATVSEVANPDNTAVADSAVVEVQTNVLNESTTTQAVTLTTQIVDASGNVVAAAPPVTQNLAPMTSANFPSGNTPNFPPQLITVTNPTLWYPNDSTFGKPYMYKVYSIVSVNGQVVDAVQSPLGIRIITWDTNFPYFNGHPMYLWGGSGRYDYPALGSSVPEEQQWRDLAQLAGAGGNIWRPGHSTSSEEFVNAADEYGIMIDQPSGDNEEAFADPTADQVTLKKELHRDMIIRDRNHPSILDWEANNGTMEESVGTALLTVVNQWDTVQTRKSADRTPDPVNGYILGCTLEGCEVNFKLNQFPNNPWLGMEYWGNGSARGLAYDYELVFAGPFLHNWSLSRQAQAFGINQWYFADSPGENGLYVEYEAIATTPALTAQYENSVRALGASMVDMNRFPKMLYYIYQAVWTPFAIKPVVKLAHHWNRAYQDNASIQENAFSNCPSVRLLINGVPQGLPQIPKPLTSDPGANPAQSTTLIPGEVSWAVNWVAGTVEAECLDEFGNVQATDSITTAGAENHINLTVVPDVVKPDGSSFAVTANGFDTAFVVAQVVDANNVVVPTASDNITFSVSGPGAYMGGADQYVQSGSDAYSTAAGNSSVNYHSPGDPQLQAEGGLTKIAIRSQFTPGSVTVTATAPGLTSGTTSYTIQPAASITTVAAAGPEIVIPPQNAAVTAGQTATFSVLATGAAPLSFQWKQNGANISGATAATYTTPATTTAESGTGYTVTVSNSLGSVTSSPAATLTVDAAEAPVITAAPQPVTAYVGQTATFNVTATGSPTLTYQWELNGAAISGATRSSYTTPILTASNNGGSYSVVVTNPVKSVPSAGALLTVDAAVAPSITTQPLSQSVLANNPVTFSVAVAGSSPFTYQWQFNGAAIAGATGSSYTIAAVQTANVGSYTVVVNNATNLPVTSAAALLTIPPPGVNLTLGQPSIASSYQDPAGLASTFAFDGNQSTRWGSAYAGTNAGASFDPDPSWIDVDLGSVQPFNTVVLYWDPAYAATYQIQYSTDNATWKVATTNNNGIGGVETLNFPTVQGRYVRMYGTSRGSNYGYSIHEFQAYNVAGCTNGSDTAEHYTVLSNNTTVLDNLSKLTWQRAQTTSTTPGGQFTQVNAQAYCSSQGMRLPTAPEALAISGDADAACAFPQPWSTWTSTPDPGNSSDAQYVSSFAVPTTPVNYQVADNFPGAVLCTSGTSVAPPTITTQPAAQTVTAGTAATFSVAAGGTGPFTYQWYANGTPITAATNASYTAPENTASGTTYFVVVTGPTQEAVISNTVALTVNGTSSGAPTILVQPVAQTVAAGATATFDVSAAGPAPLTYQWYLNGTAIQGVAETATTTNTSPGTAPIYITPATTTSNNGQLYSVKVTSATGASVTSNIVALTISGSGGGGGATAPNPPTGLTATAASSSQINLSWTASTTSGVTYDVYRSTTSGFTPSASNEVGPNVSGTTYSDTGLTASTTYYYAVEASDSAGNSTAALANQTTEAASGGGAVVTIDAGSPTAVGSYVADTTCSTGAEYDPGQTITIPSAIASIAAPEKVYESACQGSVTYTITGLVSGNSYSVLLHFAELYFTAAGKRQFDVAINGTPVAALQSFDIFAAAGGARFTAVVETVPNITATNGQIVISFTNGAFDQPMISGIEIQGAGSAPPPRPPPTTTAIDAGSPAAVGSYVADAKCSTAAEYDPGQTITIPSAIATIAAPEKVYESACQGPVTYTLAGFAANSVHTVYLHFAELYFNAAGDRKFNVAINGAPIAALQNFDIFAAAGGARFTAVVETVPNITATNGQIVISFTNSTVDQVMINGISVQ
jgi:beta-galactosidase